VQRIRFQFALIHLEIVDLEIFLVCRRISDIRKRKVRQLTTGSLKTVTVAFEGVQYAGSEA
jgi:hypothetical protein